MDAIDNLTTVVHMCNQVLKTNKKHIESLEANSDHTPSKIISLDSDDLFCSASFF